MVASASSTSTTFMGEEYLRLRHQDDDDIESWSQRECTRLHEEDCPCRRTLIKHLVHGDACPCWKTLIKHLVQREDCPCWRTLFKHLVHGEDCPCWRTLIKHLVHARHICQSTQRCREMRLHSSLSFLPEMMDDNHDMETMKEYIADIIINIVGNVYSKEPIKDL